MTTAITPVYLFQFAYKIGKIKGIYSCTAFNKETAAMILLNEPLFKNKKVEVLAERQLEEVQSDKQLYPIINHCEKGAVIALDASGRTKYVEYTKEAKVEHHPKTKFSLVSLI